MNREIRNGYEAILCDLFRTVVSFDLDKLPLVTVGEETFHSTSGAVHAILAEAHPAIDVEAFSRAWLAVSTEVQAEKLRTNREVNVGVRMGRVLSRLGLAVGDTTDLERAMVASHMGWIDRCSELPSENRRALEAMRARVHIALVSNFDCAETGRAIIDRLGLAAYFEVIVISDEIGWRKPHRIPFLLPLERMDIEPSRALFVGDSPADDIVGAKGAGLDVAWVNGDLTRLPEGTPEPDFVLGSFAELPALLGIDP